MAKWLRCVVLGHFEDPAESFFEVFLPDGHRVSYGVTAATRPMANTRVPQAWLADVQTDPRGNEVHYDWCFAEDESGYVAEYALTSIRYAPDRAVLFAYDQREEPRRTYLQGMQFQQSLQLAEVQMQAAGELVRRYDLTYTSSATTGRALLESVQACAMNGSCYAPTRFQYAMPKLGFDDVATDIAAPLSDKASPMLFDVDHDGLPEYVVGDSTPFSTPEHPITEWRAAKNTGGTLAPEKVALLQEWSVVQDPVDLADPTLLQPELGTAVDFTGGANTGILLHDVTGSEANHLVLVPNADLSFGVVDTKLRRPFPLGATPKGMRSSAASVHLADVSGDGISDLIECNDHGNTLLSTWTLRMWQPGGFELQGAEINTLAGIPCSVEMHTVDSNGDSVTDLIATGYLKQGGEPAALSGNYNVHQRRSNGTWEVFDTGLPTPKNGGRVLFLDVNGDGLPDAVQSGSPDGRGRLWTATSTANLSTALTLAQTCMKT